MRQLVVVTLGVSAVLRDGAAGPVRPAVDGGAGLLARKPAPGGERRQELVFENVEDGAELLALLLGHRIARERLACGLELAAREDFGQNSDLVEHPPEVASFDGDAERQDGALRTDDDARRRRGDEHFAGARA